MDNVELLKSSRNLLLKLHKTLVDHERRVYEGINGQLTAGQFLNVLIENQDFAWLRKFSMLIVDIDEMFAQKDGFSASMVDDHITALRKLVSMEVENEEFKAKYQGALQQDIEAATHQGDLRTLLFGQ